MKHQNRKSLLFPITLTLLTIVGLALIYITIYDSKQIRENVYNQNVVINNKIDSLSNNIDKLTRKDITSQELLYMRDEIYGFKLNIEKSQNAQKDIVENLFLEHVKNWIWIIGLIAAAIVFTGLDWNISTFITSRIKRKVSQSIEYIENVIDSEVWLSQLRTTSKLLVLNKEGAQLDNGVKTVLDLTKLKYTTIDIQSLNYEAIKDKLIGITTVFIENANSGTKATWDNKEVENNLQHFAQELTRKGVAVFYYNSASDFKLTVRFPNLSENNYLTSFANTESNIYPNLKNLLIVQKLLIDQKKLNIIS